MNYIYEHKRRTILVLGILLAIIIYLLKDSSFILRGLSLIAVISFFYILDHLFDLKFEVKHYAIVIIISTIAFMLSHLYFIYPQYDKIQHLIMPIFISAIFFFMINKLRLELKWKLLFTFLTTVAFLGIFEIIEYGLDQLFQFKLQGVYLRNLQGVEKFNLLQEPLDDTIMDISLGIIGSGLYSLVRTIKNWKKLGLRKAY